MDLKIVLRQILTDRLSLRAYKCGESCTWEDIKRRMLLNEKELCLHVPDHFYRSADRMHIHQNEIDSLRKLINKGFPLLSSHFLKWDEDKKQIYVKDYLLPEWQNLITFISPLILVSARIAAEKPFFFDRPANLTKERINRYLKDYILPNIKYTCLPNPEIDKLDELIEKTGLNDLHIHLNATTEIDVLWQDCLNYPDKCLEYFTKASGDFLVREQIEYEDAYKDAEELYRLLITARALRYAIISDYLLCPPDKEPEKWNNENIDSFFQLTVSEIHPLEDCLKNTIEQNESDITLECMMHIMIMSRLMDNSPGKYKDHLASLYHYYLLIEGVINKFVVQQLHQKGFQQFAKIADNGFRKYSEGKYACTFLQLNGNRKSRYLINHIEGRFTPDGTSGGITTKIGEINAGLEEYMRTIHENYANIEKPIPDIDKNKLFSLTAHFIKSRDKTENSEMQTARHRILRKKLWKQAKAITDYNKIPKGNTSFNIPITGIDAASSEFNVPPEVFGPVYRLLRKENSQIHFTFHVGEDFSHIVSGLRAMYEAVEFLDLQPTDRIGHGTALGMCPEQWISKMGKYIYISQGEWLDNLIFIYHLIPVGIGIDKEIINKEIEDLSNKVYGKVYSTSDLIRAWSLRKYCPLLFSCKNLSEAPQDIFDPNEWSLILEEKKVGFNQDVEKLMELYHYSRESHNKIIHAKDSFFTYNQIKLFQSWLSGYLVTKGIIIEILPTSNTRISIYDSTREHHALKWLSDNKISSSLSKKRQFPELVIGTDDPGIFSTNIYNEYAHVYSLLKESGEFNTDEVIEKLYINSFKYCFPPQK